jgi:hypothetical protein
MDDKDEDGNQKYETFFRWCYDFGVTPQCVTQWCHQLAIYEALGPGNTYRVGVRAALVAAQLKDPEDRRKIGGLASVLEEAAGSAAARASPSPTRRRRPPASGPPAGNRGQGRQRKMGGWVCSSAL